MSTVIIKEAELPKFLPQGWKTKVAKTLGCHPNTITNALRAGKGPTYDRIVKAAVNKYGTAVKTETK